jgi:hypothetical protein
MNKNIFMYSVFSGTFYTIPEKDASLMPPGHYPLKSPPKNCKKCYNRGHLGRNLENLIHPPCSCVTKNLNLDILKEIENKYFSKQLPGQQSTPAAN